MKKQNNICPKCSKEMKLSEKTGDGLYYYFCKKCKYLVVKE